MRSLPPPRITRKRRWKRIKRALKNFFTKGYVSDPGAFVSHANTSNKRSVSTIKKSRLTSRFRRKNFTDGVGLRDGANMGMRTVGTLGRLASKASVPLMRPITRTNLVNLTVSF
ncbi:uncharacterized protein PRCAT00002878001 [Priceomyces carsonii]|uniref:uncharacterized protein n=1 Tax=Priceomyces carsonii TaxID=28549 RepID=UPI002ED95182|nr:unnamed protein product [Priceomyces carsonii]